MSNVLEKILNNEKKYFLEIASYQGRAAMLRNPFLLDNNFISTEINAYDLFGIRIEANTITPRNIRDSDGFDRIYIIYKYDNGRAPNKRICRFYIELQEKSTSRKLTKHTKLAASEIIGNFYYQPGTTTDVFFAYVFNIGSCDGQQKHALLNCCQATFLNPPALKRRKHEYRKTAFRRHHVYTWEEFILLYIPLYNNNIISPYRDIGLEIEGCLLPAFYNPNLERPIFTDANEVDVYSAIEFSDIQDTFYNDSILYTY